MALSAKDQRAVYQAGISGGLSSAIASSIAGGYSPPAPAPAPAPTYSAPAPSYSAPAPTYSAPAPTYSAPAPTTGLTAAAGWEVNADGKGVHKIGDVDPSAPTPTSTPTSNTATPELSQFGNFDRQLQFGSRGEDVKRLQQFLNVSGFTVAKEGEPGSVGNETDFFGPATQKALQEYQKSQGIVSKGDPTSTGFGRLGPQTMESINSFTQPIINREEVRPDVDKINKSEVLPDVPNPKYDKALENILKNPNITDDQKDMANRLYDIVSRNDKEQAQKMIAAFEAGLQFSEPFFKAQVAMVTNALNRTLLADEGDLEFAQTSLENTLNDLRQDIQATKGQLDFTQEQQLKGLERSYGQDLENTRQSLASVGKTRSSVRTRKEAILSEQHEGLVESTNRGFSFQKGQLTDRLSRGERNTQAQLKQLQDEATQKRIAELHGAEEKLGSKRLSGLGFTDLIGGVGGSIERNRVKDALAFSGGAGFVF